jgi:L-lactate dehydrogenase complex protein LldG
MQDPGLIKTFRARAEAVQAVVIDIENLEEAVRYAVEVTKQQGGRTIVALGIGDEKIRTVQKECAAAGLTLLEPPLRPEANNIHTALTLVDGGIAETGSLVLGSSSEDMRIATMLAEVHVAVVRAPSIVPDTQALEETLDAALKAETASYTAFITGPSRTADIERVLAIGVHGPQELHILMWEGPAS